ncbi:MAG TPA: 50S ribosomal protein L9 [Chloroflexota bacterium]|nr:50S ribosomal protein L9 [Chloroflexota bacterium]
MKVVLRKDVPSLGRAGEVKEVSDGYGRNYLIPRGLAAIASKTAVQNVEAHKAAESRQQARLAAEHEALAKRLTETPIVVRAHAGEQGRLYGSVTTADVADAIKAALGQTVDKRDVELEEPIRTVGMHHVRVHVAPRVIATVNVEVVGDRP